MGRGRRGIIRCGMRGDGLIGRRRDWFERWRGSWGYVGAVEDARWSVGDDVGVVAADCEIALMKQTPLVVLELAGACFVAHDEGHL